MDAFLWELLEEGSPDDWVNVLIRSADLEMLSNHGIKVVAQIGNIYSCRIRRGDILTVRNQEVVASMKAQRSLYLDPPLDEHFVNIPTDYDSAPEPARPELPFTGRGVCFGIADWGFDFTHCNFLHPDGTTRFKYLWDQGSEYDGTNSYGYGAVYSSAQINEALQSEYPFRELNYYPGKMDIYHNGMHGTHVLDIATGSGTVGRRGVAPDCDLLAVHLSTERNSSMIDLGTSVSVFDAIHFLHTMAGECPLVINMSVGSHGDAHTGLSLVEQAIDQLVSSQPNRAVVQSCGNYFASRVHAEGKIANGETISLQWLISKQDTTPNEIEIWYEPGDEIQVSLISPDGELLLEEVPVGKEKIQKKDGEETGRFYHRQNEPNTNLSNIVIILDENAEAGNWNIKLTGKKISNGRFHSWIERDRGNLQNQSRFSAEQARTSTTTGSICNGFHTISVGAYDDRDAGSKVGFFSSVGPTWDGRQKPDMVSAGVGILAAKSASPYQHRSACELTSKTGTSMAAPRVAGAIALIYEHEAKQVNIQHVRNRLLQACRMPAGDETDKLRFGAGILDIEKLFSMNTINVSEEFEYSRPNKASLDSIPMESLIEASERKIPELTNDNLEYLFESLPPKSARDNFNLRRGDIVIRRQYGHHDGAWYGIVEFVGDNVAHVTTKNGPRKIKLSLSWELRKLRPDYDFVDKEESVFGEDLDASVKNFTELKKNAASNQINTIFKRISGQTCLKHPDLPNNPLIGVTDQMIKAAHNAHHFHGTISTPDVLMAIWKKEGSDFQKKIHDLGLNGITASGPDRALTLFRSQIYFIVMGMDELIHYTPVAGGDNHASFTETDASDHEHAFATKISGLVKSGYLKRNIGPDIDGGLKVRTLSNGVYEVKPTLHFYIYSLLAMDAMFREHEDRLKSISGYGGIPDIGLIYMHWNLGHTKMEAFIKSADQHRKEKEYLVSGNPISIVEWAFNHCPKKGEWDVPRENAIKLRYFAEIFKLVFV